MLPDLDKHKKRFQSYTTRTFNVYSPKYVAFQKKFKVWYYLISSTLKYVSDLTFGTEWKLGSGASMGGTEEPLLFQQELRLGWMTKTKKTRNTTAETDFRVTILSPVWRWDMLSLSFPAPFELVAEFSNSWKLVHFLPLPSPSSLHISLVNFMSATIQHYCLQCPTSVKKYFYIFSKSLGQIGGVCNIWKIDIESPGFFFFFNMVWPTSGVGPRALTQETPSRYVLKGQGNVFD